MPQNLGEGPPAQRPCAADDRTGHAMLHTLYSQSLKYDADFFIEYFAIDLIMENGTCRGVVALNLDDGSVHRFRAQAVEIGTEGYGLVNFVCNDSHTRTRAPKLEEHLCGFPILALDLSQLTCT